DPAAAREQRVAAGRVKGIAGPGRMAHAEAQERSVGGAGRAGWTAQGEHPGEDGVHLAQRERVRGLRIAQGPEDLPVPDRLQVDLAGGAAAHGHAGRLLVRLQEVEHPVEAVVLVKPGYQVAELSHRAGPSVPGHETVGQLVGRVARYVQQLHRTNQGAVEVD